MNPIPKAAQVIAEELRLHVPKPVTLPIWESTSWGRFLGVYRWPVDIDRASMGLICPMGLHPEAVVGSPSEGKEFPVYVPYPNDPGSDWDLAVDLFGRWWDSIKEGEAQEAIDAIWGPVEGVKQ
jgi:hypothetical protein